MSESRPLGTVLTAMVTPMHADGTLDIDSAIALANHLLDHGSDGLVISGTTGEAPTTHAPEKLELTTALVEAVGHRATLIAGAGSNDTAHAVMMAEQATEAGVDGVLALVPYYSKPSQKGVVAHLNAIAGATDLPVMLYDVPGRTATTIEIETYEAMRRYDHVTSVKEATGLLARTAQLVDMGYAVYSGDDANTLGYLAYGGVGLVSVVAHAAGDQLAAMISAWADGDHAEALRIHTSLVPAFDAVMGVPNYGATTAKAALELLGVLDNRRVRGPLVALDDDEVTALRAGLAAAGLL